MNPQNIKPILDYVFAKRLFPDELKSDSGIYLGEAKPKKCDEAVVIAVGPTFKENVKPGDKIIVPGKHVRAFTEIHDGEDTYMFVNEEFIHGVIED